MEHRAQERTPISNHHIKNSPTPDASDEATDEATVNGAEGTPLRRYLATLEQGGEGVQLIRQIRVYLYKAGLENTLSGRDHAAEILQEAVIEALAAEERFDPARSPKAWLLGIVAKVILRHRERLFRQNKHEIVASDLAASNASSHFSEEELFTHLVALHQDGPEQKTLGAMSAGELLAQLPSADRQMIELNVLHEMNSKEIAQMLGISESNVRVRLHRALKKLKPIWLRQETGRKEKQNHE